MKHDEFILNESKLFEEDPIKKPLKKFDKLKDALKIYQGELVYGLCLDDFPVFVLCTGYHPLKMGKGFEREIMAQVKKAGVDNENFRMRQNMDCIKDRKDTLLFGFTIEKQEKLNGTRTYKDDD